MKSTDNIEANWCTHTFQRYHNRECEASGWLGSMTLGFRASMVALSMIVQVSENLSWTFMVCGHGFSASSISAITAPRRGTLAQASEQSTAEQYRVLCRVRNAWIGLGQGLADKGDDCHRPVLAQSQRRDLGFLRIRPVDRVAIVPQRQVRTPFGIPRHFRPFRPGVAVAVQRHALKAEADTALLEHGGASRLILAQLILKWARALGHAIVSYDPDGAPVVDKRETMLVSPSPANACALAKELGALIDEFIIENVDPSSINGLAGETFDQYWAITTRFLSIALRQWPLILEQRGMIDRAQRQRALLAAQIEHLKRAGEG